MVSGTSSSKILNEIVTTMASLNVNNSPNGSYNGSCNVPSSSLSQKTSKASPIETVPSELWLDITNHLDANDLKNLRLTSRGSNNGTKKAFAKRIGETKKIYPTPDSINSWLRIRTTDWAPYILQVTVVGETLREHIRGYDWAWQTVQHASRYFFDANDVRCVREVTASHSAMVAECQNLVTSGLYRTCLVQLLRNLSGLRKITGQMMLESGEHVPGWDGTVRVRDITGLRDYDINVVFYDDWQYDEQHLMVTLYEDELGFDAHDVANPGPQARFYQDFMAATEEKKQTNGEVEVILVWKDTHVVLQ